LSKLNRIFFLPSPGNFRETSYSWPEIWVALSWARWNPKVQQFRIVYFEGILFPIS
jgi:hypothetical protein